MRVQLTLIAVTVFTSIVTAAPHMSACNQKLIIPNDEFENIDLASFPELTPDEEEVQDIETKGENEIKTALGKLQILHQDMREFVSMAGLDYQDFQPKMEEMENQLSEVVSTIENEETKNMLAEDLEFIESMLEKVGKASEILKKYDDDYSVPGAELICQVTNAHVAALGLRDMHGQLDTKIADYEDKISYLNNFLPLLKENFSEIKEVYPVERRVFEAQVSETQEAMEELGISFQI